MNDNTAYEKFTQEVYQELVNADTVKSTRVQHDVKIEGKSGQKHQIDVYWEYEIAGTKHKVAIECKNYNRKVSIGHLRDFHGVLTDLNNVNGIMVTKIGFQNGVKKYAQTYGIQLKELRKPQPHETICEFESETETSVCHRLFLINEDYAKEHGFSITKYREWIDDFRGRNEWENSKYLPLTLNTEFLTNKEGEAVANLDDIKCELNNVDATFKYNEAFVDTPWGKLKIDELKYEHKHQKQTQTLKFDAWHFVKAILKDAQNGETILV